MHIGNYIVEIVACGSCRVEMHSGNAQWKLHSGNARWNAHAI
jgi:hypothetical protein